ncbi:hypothetical protein MMC15_004173 [Xylographa vitiligo]|nr:hypothetical protein [Xylographa vitiligo]
MAVVLLFIMAKAPAADYGSSITFRFLCTVFAASPMAVAGGTISDIWTPMQLHFGLTVDTFAAYESPFLGPVISSSAPHWVFVLLAQSETFGPGLLEWGAKDLSGSLGTRLLTNVYRPFTMIFVAMALISYIYHLTKEAAAKAAAAG